MKSFAAIIGFITLLVSSTSNAAAPHSGIVIENIGFDSDKSVFVFKITNDSETPITYPIFIQTKRPDSAALQQFLDGKWQGFYGCGLRDEAEQALYSDFTLEAHESQLTSLPASTFKPGDEIRVELGYKAGSDVFHIYSDPFIIK